MYKIQVVTNESIYWYNEDGNPRELRWQGSTYPTKESVESKIATLQSLYPDSFFQWKYVNPTIGSG